MQATLLKRKSRSFSETDFTAHSIKSFNLLANRLDYQIKLEIQFPVLFKTLLDRFPLVRDMIRYTGYSDISETHFTVLKTDQLLKKRVTNLLQKGMASFDPRTILDFKGNLDTPREVRSLQAIIADRMIDHSIKENSVITLQHLTLKGIIVDRMKERHLKMDFIRADALHGMIRFLDPVDFSLISIKQALFPKMTIFSFEFQTSYAKEHHYQELISNSKIPISTISQCTRNERFTIGIENKYVSTVLELLFGPFGLKDQVFIDLKIFLKIVKPK